MALKKVGVTSIPGIEEVIEKINLFKIFIINVLLLNQVNMIKDDGEVIHFNNPKVQASLASNTFAITGHSETKSNI